MGVPVCRFHGRNKPKNDRFNHPNPLDTRVFSCPNTIAFVKTSVTFVISVDNANTVPYNDGVNTGVQ